MDKFNETINIVSGDYLLKDKELIFDERLTFSERDVYSTLIAVDGRKGYAIDKLCWLYPSEQKTAVLEAVETLSNYGYITFDKTNGQIKVV